MQYDTAVTRCFLATVFGFERCKSMNRQMDAAAWNADILLGVEL